MGCQGSEQPGPGWSFHPPFLADLASFLGMPPGPLRSPSLAVWASSPTGPPHLCLVRSTDSPNSSVLWVSQALMPGLVLGLVMVAETQTGSRSRRQSHAVPRGWSWYLEAGAEDMSGGHAAGVETPSLCTSTARTYIKDREPRVTSAHMGTPQCSSHRKPSLAQRMTQRGSRIPRCSALVGTGECRVPRHPLPAPRPGGAHEPGTPARAPHRGTGAACGDTQRPGRAKVTKSFSCALPGSSGGHSELVLGQGDSTRANRAQLICNREQQLFPLWEGLWEPCVGLPKFQWGQGVRGAEAAPSEELKMLGWSQRERNCAIPSKKSRLWGRSHLHCQTHHQQDCPLARVSPSSAMGYGSSWIQPGRPRGTFSIGRASSQHHRGT